MSWIELFVLGYFFEKAGKVFYVVHNEVFSVQFLVFRDEVAALSLAMTGYLNRVGLEGTLFADRSLSISELS